MTPRPAATATATDRAAALRRGWCPGALRPMPAGDGLLVRLRPRGGRLSAAQSAGLAELATHHGSGAVDLGSRASLQLRGVPPAALPELQRGLAALGLLDRDPRLEARRNILVSPMHGPNDPTAALLDQLETALADLTGLPDLPAKFGFALDTGALACLQDCSTDLRLEQTDTGALLLRASGMARGEILPGPAALAARLAPLLHWFKATGCRRMAEALAQGLVPPLRAEAPPRPQTGRKALLAALPLLFAPFGASSAAALRELAGRDLQLTPWRAVLPQPALPDATAPLTHWLRDPNDPRLRLSACPGAPHCATATVATRELALRLAPLVPTGQHLHVSGCAKGCAHPGPADLTLTGQNGHFALILQGSAGDAPVRHDLDPDLLSPILRGHFASQL